MDDPASKYTYVDRGCELAVTRSFTAYHPPLYYTALAIVQRPLEGASILVRVLASRWVSAALGVATVALAYAAGQELWPEQLGWALLLATLVSFQPMATFVTAVMGNEAMEIALFSACLLASLRIVRYGLTWRRVVILGLLVSLGLLTKSLSE